jgi:hypothetical protein
MPHFMTVKEAAIELNTTANSIQVTVCHYKKKHAHYPTWYSSNGIKGTSRAYVDVQALRDTRQKLLNMHTELTTTIYWDLLKRGYNNPLIASILAERSPIFKSKSSWISFIQTPLFLEPQVKFFEEDSRISEFYRIGKEMLCSA